MIPKKIHYCWFGGDPLPKLAVKCIDSWKKFLPGYEIIEWNETNYNVKMIPYIAQAYSEKKFAFVSDYARFDILYHEGGLYFDTDVELIKSFDDILETGAFMGCETDGRVASLNIKKNDTVLINPGLGMAAVSGMRIYKTILEYYAGQKFVLDNGTINTETVVTKTTRILKRYGLQDIKGIQRIEGITIYPKDFFNPFNDTTGKMELTENTHSIHWYSKSWLSNKEIMRSKVTRPFHRVFGENCFDFLKKKEK